MRFVLSGLEYLDLIGLQCPIPVLKIRKVIKTMNTGDTLNVVVSDKAAKIDIPHFCNETENKLIEIYEKNDLIYCKIQVK